MYWSFDVRYIGMFYPALSALILGYRFWPTKWLAVAIGSSPFSYCFGIEQTKLPDERNIWGGNFFGFWWMAKSQQWGGCFTFCKNRRNANHRPCYQINSYGGEVISQIRFLLSQM
jgi:hypothetical protein